MSTTKSKILLWWFFSCGLSWITSFTSFLWMELTLFWWRPSKNKNTNQYWWWENNQIGRRPMASNNTTTFPKPAANGGSWVSGIASHWHKYKLVGWDPVSSLHTTRNYYLIYKIFQPPQPAPDSYIVNTLSSLVIGRHWTHPWTKKHLNPIGNFSGHIYKYMAIRYNSKTEAFPLHFASRTIGITETYDDKILMWILTALNVVRPIRRVTTHYSQVIVVWWAAGIPINQICDPDNSIEEKLRYLFQMYNNTHIDRVTRFLPFWLKWRIWKSRNDLVNNRKMIFSRETRRSSTYWYQGMALLYPEPENWNGSSQLTKVRKAKWSKSLRGWMKCNYDASHHEGDQDSGLGWIIKTPKEFFKIVGSANFKVAQHRKK